MDLLSQRYADPYLILDDFIRLQQLHGFLETIMQSIAEEKVQDIRWEYYLHKVWDMSFEEYIAACRQRSKASADTGHWRRRRLCRSSRIQTVFWMDLYWNHNSEHGKKVRNSWNYLNFLERLP